MYSNVIKYFYFILTEILIKKWVYTANQSL